MQAGCVNDQVPHGSGLKQAEVLNCGSGVGTDAHFSSLYLALAPHRADRSFYLGIKAGQDQSETSTKEKIYCGTFPVFKGQSPCLIQY